MLPLPRTGGTPPRVCIDPGHGGADPGALGQGFQEKDLVLDVGLRLAQLLEADTADTTGGGAWEVLLTRATDTYVSLYDRVLAANAWPADTFVSIHANAFDSSAATGIETYSYQEGTHSAALRDLIQARMTEAWPLPDRGSKTGDWYILRETWMPATLSELGFITSPVDIQWLSSPEERQRAAEAHLFALQEHHGFDIHLPFPPPTTRCTAKANSLGCLPAAGWSGSPTLTGPDDFHLTAERIISRQPGILFFGFEAADTPFAGGTLCVAPPLVRTAPSTSGGSPPPACDGAFDASFAQTLMAAQGLAPGDTLHAQFWYRDPFHADGSGIGMTDAVAFTVAP
jgi:N-acetylmuramoyl-L-alanine amidase